MNKLLITTMLKFVLWDDKPYVLHEGDLSKGSAHYNGITWDNDLLYVSANVDTKYVIRIFDKSGIFNTVDILNDADLHETHQIFWYDDKLYATNTGLNRIEIMDHAGRWTSHAWNEATCDIDHINGIWVDPSGAFYFSEFGNRDENKNPSKIRICDSDLETIKEINIGDGIHNVYSDDSGIYTLISDDQPRILKASYSLGMIGFNPLPVEGGLIRGLARTKDYWYIGVSRWEIERDKRHVGDAIVLQLDNDFKEVDRIIMPDFGPVCDIRVIDAPDLAHNGVRFS